MKEVRPRFHIERLFTSANAYIYTPCVRDKQVEAYKRFRHPNCIRCLDSAVTQETDGKVI